MTPRALGWRFWARFILACAIVQGGEVLVHKVSADRTDQPAFGDTLLVLSGVYNRLISAPRPPTVRHTTVVEINPALDVPSATALNVCSQRSFLAQLLARLDAAEARVIVIDKFFSSEVCGQDDLGTKSLRATISEVRSRRPVVVGVLALPLTPGQRHQNGVSHYLSKSLEFQPGAHGQQEGVINVSKDTRRLPLQWVVSPDLESAKAGRAITTDTLSLVASQLADPYLLRNSPRLSKLLWSGEHPYVGLLSPRQYWDHRYFGSEIVCGRRIGVGEDWRACAGELPPPEGLKGRVIIVGEDNAQLDQHWSAVGKMPGFYLQASYIEALLDDRLYTPAGWTANVSVSLAILFLLELVLFLTHGSLWKGLLLASATVASCVVLVYLLVVHTGYYLDPFLITGVAITMKLLHPILNLASLRQETKQPNRRA